MLYVYFVLLSIYKFKMLVILNHLIYKV